jgi:hypothetical protein
MANTGVRAYYGRSATCSLLRFRGQAPRQDYTELHWTRDRNGNPGTRVPVLIPGLGYPFQYPRVPGSKPVHEFFV